VADAAGTIQLTQTYDPYGTLYASSGTADSTFGWAGEQSDSNSLIYLRARYYNPATGRFLNMDPSRLEMNPYQYAVGNPVMYTDPSGLSPSANCGNWPASLRKLCQRADYTGPIENTPQDALDARFMIYTGITMAAETWPQPGYFTASRLLRHYLHGNGSSLKLNSPGPAFRFDDGILRATLAYRRPSIGALVRPGEAETLDPLLWIFIKDIQESQVENTSIQRNYSGETDGNYKPDDNRPRPHGIGWYSAVGHIDIDGRFNGRFYGSCGEGILSYTATFTIEDDYEWFPNKVTPFPYGITIPHAWALSLEHVNRAHPFTFTLEWTHSDQIYISKDPTMYSSLRDSRFQNERPPKWMID
jgi:RHS repeat-associated protein